MYLDPQHRGVHTLPTDPFLSPFLFTPEYLCSIYSRTCLCVRAKHTVSRGNHTQRAPCRDPGTPAPLATEQPETIWSAAKSYTSSSAVYKYDIACCVLPAGAPRGQGQPAPDVSIPSCCGLGYSTKPGPLSFIYTYTFLKSEHILGYF